VKSALVLLVLFVLHTLPLWDVKNAIVGGIEDPAAQAAMPEFYCDKILKWDLHDGRYFAPGGIDLSNNYDSPFPLVLTCPLRAFGGHVQFHFFAALNVLLVLLSAWLVARALFPASTLWQLAYVGFVWWSGFYITRVHQHYTLLAGIWGFQLMLWMFLRADWLDRRKTLLFGLVMGLVFCGTIHNVALLSIPTLILLAYSLRPLARSRQALLNFALAAAVCVAVFVFFFAPALAGFFKGELVRVPADRAKYGFDLLGPFLPWAKNLLYAWSGLQPGTNLERYNSFEYFAVKGRLKNLPLLRPLLWIAILSWIYSLGPVIHVNHTDLFQNPLDRLWSHLPLLSISRTPARFASLTYMSFVFLVFASAKNMPWPKWTAPALIAWVVITGPFLNQRWTLPYAEFRPFFPMRALEEIKAAPEDSIVVNVPIFFSGDPTQNFLQLFHRKPITAGYLAYVSYSSKVLAGVAADPLLSQMNCTGHLFQFTGEGLVTNADQLREHMWRRRFRFIIVNKLSLTEPGCENLFAWVQTLSQYPWIRLIEESQLYAVFAIREHN
jgi:hypothetical protein